MPDSSEESSQERGSLTSSLRHAGDAARQGHVWFWFECTQLLPALKFRFPSQLLEVKQGYSPSVIFPCSSLMLLPQSPNRGSNLSLPVCTCTWGLSAEGEVSAWSPRDRGKASPEQDLGRPPAGLQFITQGCSHQINTSGKTLLLQVKQPVIQGTAFGNRHNQSCEVHPSETDTK